MTKPFCVTLAFTLLLALSNTASAETANEAARSFITQSHAGEDLAAIALSAAKRTQTYGTLPCLAKSMHYSRSTSRNGIRTLLPLMRSRSPQKSYRPSRPKAETQNTPVK